MNVAEDVYYSLIGELESPLSWVPNAFEPGMPCEKLYQEVQLAYEKIRQRLGVVDEDEDIEAIIDSLMMIQSMLCIEMFRLGIVYKKNADRAVDIPCATEENVL